MSAEFKPAPFIRKGLSADEVTEIKELFDLFDVAGKGGVEVRELRTSLLNIGITEQNPGLFRLLGRIENEDPLKILRFQEFLDVLTERVDEAGKCTSMKDATRLFQIFNVDNTGFISLSNLQTVSGMCGEALTTAELREMIGRADTDGDGLVTLQDFYLILNKEILR